MIVKEWKSRGKGQDICLAKLGSRKHFDEKHFQTLYDQIGHFPFCCFFDTQAPNGGLLRWGSTNFLILVPFLFLKSIMVLSNHLYAHKCHKRYLLPHNFNGILFTYKIQFEELQAFLAYQKNSTKFYF